MPDATRSVITGFSELTLETDDIPGLVAFYRDVLGLPVLTEDDDRTWLGVGRTARLGIWSPGRKEFGDRGGAHVHFAFEAAPDGLGVLAGRLRAAGAEPEGPVEHDGGDRSLYFRDPAGNLVEAWDFFRRERGRREGVTAFADESRGDDPEEGPMELRYLGRTGLRVSVLSFGAMTFGGGRSPFFRTVGDTGLDAARRQVDVCLDAGVTLFDTADVYSDGASEEILGQALGTRRASVVLATKLHGVAGPGPNDRGASRHHVVRACEASLRRLGTDWIDLLQLHGVDGRTDVHETLRALDDLVRAGKVRAIGCSNHAAWQLMKALSVSEREGLSRLCVLQAYYSLVARDLEWELQPLCVDQDVSILVWSPLSGGFLSGKVRRGAEPPAGSRTAAWGPPGGLADREAALDLVEVQVRIAEERGVSPAQVALAWLLARPAVASAIVGARTEEQLVDDLGAAGLVLTPEEVDALDRASATRIPYPQWHQLRYNAERITDPWTRFARPDAG